MSRGNLARAKWRVMKDIKTGYHFTKATLRDGRPIPPIGEWLEHEGDIVPCDSGLHMSEHPYDALRWAPGTLLHRVELSGDIITHGNLVDKLVGRRRRRIATIEANTLLQEYSLWCAKEAVYVLEANAGVKDILLEALDIKLMWLVCIYADEGLETARNTVNNIKGKTSWGPRRDTVEAVEWAICDEAVYGGTHITTRYLCEAAIWAICGDDVNRQAYFASVVSAQRTRLAEMVDAEFAKAEDKR